MSEYSSLTTTIVRFIIQVLILLLFLNLLRGLLLQVDEKNRRFAPNLVWLNLIPLFEYVWIPITLVKVRDSLRAEYATRGLANDMGETAYKVGLASWALYLANLVFQLMTLFLYPALLAGAIVTSLMYIGLWIAYWVRSANIKNMLAFPLPVAPGAPYPGYVTPALQAPPHACPSCGAVAYPGDVFCRSCGSHTEVAPVAGATPASGSPTVDASAASASPAAGCPFCGAAYRPNAQFCSTCGRPVV